MEKGKKYVSKFKGVNYDVFINPNEKMDAYSVSIYNGDNYIGAVKGVVNSVKEGLKEASGIIVIHSKKQKNESSIDGNEQKPKNTIKLAWLDGIKTDSVLHTQTFDTIADALKNVTKDKKEWFIFKLSQGDGKTESTWELLPYGSSSNYRRGVNVTNNVLVKTGVVILSGLGVYFLFTKLKPFIFKS